VSGSQGSKLASGNMAASIVPISFTRAGTSGLSLLANELTMPALRDLASEVGQANSAETFMRCLRRRAKSLFDAQDAGELGVLAEIFRWTGKGSCWAGWAKVLEGSMALARKGETGESDTVSFILV
jgi:hypothetical protein